jgi:hypothetical protein
MKIFKNNIINILKIKYRNFIVFLNQIQSAVKIFLAKNKIKILKTAKKAIYKYYRKYQFQIFLKKIRLIQKYLKGL